MLMESQVKFRSPQNIYKFHSETGCSIIQLT